MTSPTIPESEKRMRVQDLEQSAAKQEGPLAPAVPGLGEADDPSPPTTPVYLRSVPKEDKEDAVVAPPAFDARKQTLTAQSAAIVDSITVGLADALAVSLRPVVASTIEALIPMILSLGSVPDDGAVEEAVDESVIAPPSKDFPAAS